MKFSLVDSCKEKLLLAAHRGVAGGNIPCNTPPAYEAALIQGADMIEIDISRSADGELFVFHPGMEPVTLYSARYIKDMTAKEVDSLVLVNPDRTPTQFHVPRLDEILEQFKGRCYINIDKFWMWPDEIAARVRAFGMQDQVLVKTAGDPKVFDRVEEVAADLPYMIIATDRDDYSDELKRRKLRYVGVEALFAKDDAPICSEEYIESMHKKDLIVWANAIVYNHKAVLSAGHNDDISAPGDPDNGWGWLAKRGFDVIQTDWIMQCAAYLKEKGLR